MWKSWFAGHNHLAAIYFFSDVVGRCTYLSELHDEVHETGGEGGVLALGSQSLEQVLDPDLPLESHVQELLSDGERAVHKHLQLVRQLVLHVHLDPPEHERLQDHVEPGDLHLVHGALAALRRGLNVLWKRRLKTFFLTRWEMAEKKSTKNLAK